MRSVSRLAQRSMLVAAWTSTPPPCAPQRLRAILQRAQQRMAAEAMAPSVGH